MRDNVQLSLKRGKHASRTKPFVGLPQSISPWPARFRRIIHRRRSGQAEGLPLFLPSHLFNLVAVVKVARNGLF